MPGFAPRAIPSTATSIRFAGGAVTVCSAVPTTTTLRIWKGAKQQIPGLSRPVLRRVQGEEVLEVIDL